MNFDQLLEKVTQDYPKLNFKLSDHFSWSQITKTIQYKKPGSEKEVHPAISQLLHELAHAKLNHTIYKSDAQLLKIEAEAWAKAEELAKEYGVELSKKEQKQALQSYIGWASSRSSCPNCQKNGLQISKVRFTCLNCSHKWTVSPSRFTRTYRK